VKREDEFSKNLVSMCGDEILHLTQNDRWWGICRPSHAYQLNGNFKFPSLDGRGVGEGERKGEDREAKPPPPSSGQVGEQSEHFTHPLLTSPIKGEEGGGREMVLS
jgi:hypothetical protein